MAIEIKVKFETLRSLGFASIGAAYMGVGTEIAHPARMILIQNFSNQPLMFSLDGINDHLPIMDGSAFIFDVSSNKTIDSGFFIEKGTRLYVKEIDTTPTSGKVYFTIFYGSED